MIEVQLWNHYEFVKIQRIIDKNNREDVMPKETENLQFHTGCSYSDSETI